MTERNDDPITNQRATGLPSNGWAYRRLAVGLALPLAALVLLLLGARTASGVLFVAAAVTVPFMTGPVGVLIARHLRRRSVTEVSQ